MISQKTKYPLDENIHNLRDSRITMPKLDTNLQRSQELLDQQVACNPKLVKRSPPAFGIFYRVNEAFK
jgi:hypothetical protein